MLKITDYGAKGDGVQNDTQYILKGLQFAKDAGIKEIYFPAGTYLIDRGFNLPDGTTVYGDGEKTLLLLQKGLPQRVDNRFQAAVFMGAEQYKGTGVLGSTIPNQNITIRDLSMDLQRDPASLDASGNSFPMMGGINLLNAVNCTIRNVKISNPWIWGIQIACNGDSEKDVTGNLIDNCTIELTPNWYISPNSPRWEPPIIGIELASEISKFSNNGAAESLTRDAATYIPSRAYNNTIRNCKITGGSHGISLSNAKDNKIEGNNVSGCSNRGIILSARSDENMINDNKVSNIGSTGIHMAYNSDRNKVYRNEVFNITCCEGDAIKAYVNCNYNDIQDNYVHDFAVTGIRVAHGAIGNIIKNNRIDGGSPTTGKFGIKVLANTYNQYFKDNLKFGDKLVAEDNIVEGNDIKNVETPLKVADEVFTEKKVAEKNKVIEKKPLSSKKTKPLFIGGIILLSGIIFYGLYKYSRNSN